MELCSGGQGNVGPSDQTTPRTPHTAPLLSTKQSTTCSTTPPRPTEGATDANRPIIDSLEAEVVEQPYPVGLLEQLYLV